MDNPSDKTLALDHVLKPRTIDMSRRVSTRSAKSWIRWGALLLVVVTLPLGAVVIYRTYLNWAAKSLLAEAARAENQGNPWELIESLQSYVHLVPGDLRTLARYGLVCAKHGESFPYYNNAALRSLEVVLLAEPKRDDLRRVAAEVALRLKNIPRANEHIQTLLKADPDDAEAEALFAKCQVALEQYHDAALWFDRACKHSPDRIENYVTLAHLLRDHFDMKERDLIAKRIGRRPAQIMNDMVAANPDSARAYLERARYHLARPTHQRMVGISFKFVDDDLARAYELAPDDVGILATCADAAIAGHRPNDARTYFEKALSLHPQDGVLACKFVRFELHENRIDVATRQLREAVERSPNDWDLKWTFADLLIQAGELEEGRQMVKKLRDAGAANARRIGYLESGLLMREGDWMNATVGFEIASSAGELREIATYWLSRCYKQLGDLEGRLGTIQTLVEIWPADWRYHFELGFELLTLGKSEEASDRFREVRKLRLDLPDAWLALTRVLMIRENRSMPTLRNWRPIEVLLDGADRLFPDRFQFQIMRAEVLAAQRQFDRATQLLEKSKARWPERVEFYNTQAEMASLLKRSAEVPAIFDGAQRRLGDSVDLRLGRARYFGVHASEATPNVVIDQAQDIEKFSWEDRRRLLDGLAVICYRAGRTDDAERLWTKIADREPGNLRLRLVLFELASRADNKGAIDRILAEIRRAYESLPRTEQSELPARESARNRIVKRINRLTAPEATVERTQLLDAYVSEVRRDQQWAIKPKPEISIVYFSGANGP